MNRSTKLLSLAVLAVLVIACALGQTSQGTLTGIITDPAGAVTVGATVTATNAQEGSTRTATTGPNGEYRIDAVTPGTYTLTMTSPGFEVKKIENVVVPAGVITSVNMQLELGGVSQTVLVEASPAAVRTDSGELSGTITSEQVSQIPIVSGNPIDLVLTQPGIAPVASDASFTNGEGFSVNGSRPRANNFLLDGFDDNDYGIQGQALQPAILEAVNEVNIQTNSYAPEYGRGGASVTNVIFKSGSNSFHGTAWEAYEGSALTAIPVELKNEGVTVTPQYVNNEFGFDFGGPVIKNHLFFFGTAQWDHENEDESGATLTIPTAAGVSALQSLGPNPNVNLILSSLGGITAPSETGTVNIGNRAGCGSPCLIPVGTDILTPKALDRDYQYILRADYVADEKDTFMARFIGSHNFLSPDLFANSAALPSQDTYQGGPANNFGSYWTHVYSPTKVNELRFTAQDISFLFGLLPATAANPVYQMPNVSIPELPGESFGSVSNFPQGRSHNVYEYQDAFSWTAGTHSMKMGADLVHLTENDTNFLDTIGSISVAAGGTCPSGTGTTTCTGLANFIDDFTGPAGTAGKAFGNPVLSTPQTLQGYYFQDSWKVFPNLTLTYGVRYEYQGTPLNALAYPAILPGLAGLLQPETERVPEQGDKNNFGPRFGFAYRPTFAKGLFGEDKTAIRGGFGAFYDTFFTNISVNGAQTAPNLLGGTLTAPDTGRGLAGVLAIPSTVTAALNPLAGVDTAVSNLQQPLSYQWNFDIERELPSGMLLTVAYVGARDERLFVNEQMNPGVLGVRIDPDRGSVLARTNLGNSTYNALQVNVERRFRHGLFFSGAYTWSKSLDDASEVFTNTGTSSQAQNLFDESADKGPSAFNIPQRGVISLVYEEPSFRNGTGFAKVLSWPFRDWQLSGLTDWQSGNPQTVSEDGYDQNGDLNFGNDRPNLSNPNAPINYSPSCLSNPACISGVGQINPDGSIVDWNTGAPGTASQFRYIVTNVLGIGPNGNLGRNTLQNPGRQDYTFALQRNVKLPREGHQLEFRAEAYNIFNHPNAGGGSNADGNPIEGTVSPISGDIDSPVFMNKSVTYVGGRFLQLWLKYRF
jgi:hypothetical protein